MTGANARRGRRLDGASDDYRSLDSKWERKGECNGVILLPIPSVPKPRFYKVGIRVCGCQTSMLGTDNEGKRLQDI